MTPGPPDYPVGYGRPPKAHQFKPGKSGNPKGRPKGSRSDAATLKAVLERKIAFTENGKANRLSTRELTYRGLANLAARGDLKAMKLLFDRIDRISESPGTSNPKYPSAIVVLPSNGRERKIEPE